MMTLLPQLPNRTVCGCDACRLPCRFVPGMLIPSDLTEYRKGYTFSADFDKWIDDNFLASPGAKAMKGGQVFRIPTIVPRKIRNHGCVFLTEKERCSIHESSPYGCRCFDSHMGDREGRERSELGLIAIMDDFQRVGVYASTWMRLFNAGKIAKSPEENRAEMRESCG